MSFVDYRNNSRTRWGREVEGAQQIPTREDIEFGCILRIADATEAMAKSHVDMQRSLDYYKGAHERNRAEIARLEKQRASLRGVITRMKHKATQP